MAVLDWLQQLLGGGDPEAQSAAAASTAMMPAVNQWAQNVASGNYVRQGLPSTYDPQRSFAQNALDPSGLENALNVALGVGGGSGLGIKAYHGSPYDFNAFDASKIGTGEGAQAYGHGLYFADKEGVAQQYRDALGRPAVEIGGQKFVPDRGSPEDIALAHLEDAVSQQSSAPWAKAYQSLQKARDLTPDTPTGTARSDMDQAIKVLGRWQEQGAKPANAGHMYEVNINAEPQQFLDWDKPFNEQPSNVKAAFNALAETNPALRDIGGTTGEGYYQSIGRKLGNEELLKTGSRLPTLPALGPPLASAALNQAGIPGIRYLDQGSRGAGQGTSNYVVFDPKIIEILRKYGIIPPAVGVGLLGAADQQ